MRKGTLVMALGQTPEVTAMFTLEILSLVTMYCPSRRPLSGIASQSPSGKAPPLAPLEVNSKNGC